VKDLAVVLRLRGVSVGTGERSAGRAQCAFDNFALPCRRSGDGCPHTRTRLVSHAAGRPLALATIAAHHNRNPAELRATDVCHARGAPNSRSSTTTRTLRFLGCVTRPHSGGGCGTSGRMSGATSRRSSSGRWPASRPGRRLHLTILRHGSPQNGTARKSTFPAHPQVPRDDRQLSGGPACRPPDKSPAFTGRPYATLLKIFGGGRAPYADQL
jgi:hypothetical protein